MITYWYSFPHFLYAQLGQNQLYLSFTQMSCCFYLDLVCWLNWWANRPILLLFRYFYWWKYSTTGQKLCIVMVYPYSRYLPMLVHRFPKCKKVMNLLNWVSGWRWKRKICLRYSERDRERIEKHSLVEARGDLINVAGLLRIMSEELKERRRRDGGIEWRWCFAIIVGVVVIVVVVIVMNVGSCWVWW